MECVICILHCTVRGWKEFRVCAGAHIFSEQSEESHEVSLLLNSRTACCKITREIRFPKMKWRGLRSLYTDRIINIKVLYCQENHVLHFPFFPPFFFLFFFPSFVFFLYPIPLFFNPIFSLFFLPHFFLPYYLFLFLSLSLSLFSFLFPFLFSSLFFPYLAGKISGFWTTQLCFIFMLELLLKIRIFWAWAQIMIIVNHILLFSYKHQSLDLFCSLSMHNLIPAGLVP